MRRILVIVVLSAAALPSALFADRVTADRAVDIAAGFTQRGEAGNALRKQRRINDYNTMRDRVFASGSYAEALEIIREYVDLVDLDGMV